MEKLEDSSCKATALEYFLKVKDALSSNLRFKRFLNCMEFYIKDGNGFNGMNMDVLKMVKSVIEELFRHFPQLLAEFNMFLPADHQFHDERGQNDNDFASEEWNWIAPHMHERCSEYLRSKKLQDLTQQLVTMGFSEEKSTMALMLNGCRVNESLKWLSSNSTEETDNSKYWDQNIGSCDLNVNISEELTLIANMEIQYKCLKLEVEKAVVTYGGDLGRAEEAIRTPHLHEMRSFDDYIQRVKETMGEDSELYKQFLEFLNEPDDGDKSSWFHAMDFTSRIAHTVWIYPELVLDLYNLLAIKDDYYDEDEPSDGVGIDYCDSEKDPEDNQALMKENGKLRIDNNISSPSGVVKEPVNGTEIDCSDNGKDLEDTQALMKENGEHKIENKSSSQSGDVKESVNGSEIESSDNENVMEDTQALMKENGKHRIENNTSSPSGFVKEPVNGAEIDCSDNGKVLENTQAPVKENGKHRIENNTSSPSGVVKEPFSGTKIDCSDNGKGLEDTQALMKENGKYKIENKSSSQSGDVKESVNGSEIESSDNEKVMEDTQALMKENGKHRIENNTSSPSGFFKEPVNGAEIDCSDNGKVLENAQAPVKENGKHRIENNTSSPSGVVKEPFSGTKIDCSDNGKGLEDTQALMKENGKHRIENKSSSPSGVVKEPDNGAEIGCNGNQKASKDIQVHTENNSKKHKLEEESGTENNTSSPSGVVKEPDSGPEIDCNGNQKASEDIKVHSEKNRKKRKLEESPRLSTEAAMKEARDYIRFESQSADDDDYQVGDESDSACLDLLLYLSENLDCFAQRLIAELPKWLLQIMGRYIARRDREET